MSLDMLGAVGVAGPYGDLYGGIIQAAGNLAQGAVSAYDADQAAQAASASDKAKLSTAIAADAAAANTRAAALTSAALAASAIGPTATTAKAKAAADQAAADLASSAQDRAGAALPLPLGPARVEAAEKALEAATAKLQASPTDLYAQNLVKAWNAAINKANNAQIVRSAPDKPAKDSWLTQHTIISAVPNYGVVVGGAGIAAGIFYAVKKGIFSRLLGG